jgi:hypothetical protein
MVEVAGTVGRLAGMGLVGGEREGRDGSPVTATSVASDPRRTFLQAINVLLGEQVAFLIDLAHRGPRVIEFSGGREVASDGDKCSEETEEDSNSEKSERRRVGDHSNEEAREIGTGKDTFIRGSNTPRGTRMKT